jgi:hypothetical protein
MSLVSYWHAEEMQPLLHFTALTYVTQATVPRTMICSRLRVRPTQFGRSEHWLCISDWLANLVRDTYCTQDTDPHPQQGRSMHHPGPEQGGYIGHAT